MTTSVLGSTLASLSLWTMSLIDSMVPFLLGERVLAVLQAVGDAVLRGSVRTS